MIFNYKLKSLLLLSPILILLLSLYSCSSGNRTNDMYGDWFPLYGGNLEQHYTEFVIDKEQICHYFEYAKETIICFPYEIKDGYLYLLKDSEKGYEKMGSISLVNDTLVMANEYVTGYFVRQDESPKLSQLIKKKFSEKEFSDFFSERYASWSKLKYDN